MNGNHPRTARDRAKDRGWREGALPLSYPCRTYMRPRAAYQRIVWVTGIAPATSRSRTPRSTTELHPDRRIASESNTASPVLESRPFPEGDAELEADEVATLRVTRTRGNAVHPARLVPPRGFEPLPTTFARSCPIPGTVAVIIAHRSQPMESNHHARGYEPRRCPARAARQPGIRGGNRTRVSG
jgi:hypothetical protein